MKKKLLSLLVVTILGVSFAGCAQNDSSSTTESNIAESDITETESESTVSESQSGTVYPLTINNYSIEDDGAVWAEKEQVFESAPERIVCNMQGSAEVLIRLGLGDRIVGVAGVFGDVDSDIKEEFYKIPMLSEDYAGQEVILGANPDFVIGRGDLFVDADYGSGTVDFLNDSGIRTYIMNTGKEGAVFDDFFTDIDELGQIFDVQEAADALIEQYQKQIDDLTNNPAWNGKEKTIAEIASVEDGNFVVSSGKGEYFQNDALQLVGLNNIFKDAPAYEVSNEELIESNPDVLLLFKYNGGPDTDVMVEELYQNETLQDVTAIKEKQIYVADFNAFYGTGGGIFNAVSNLAQNVWLSDTQD